MTCSKRAIMITALPAVWVWSMYSWPQNGLTKSDCIRLSSKTQFNKKKSIKTLPEITDTETNKKHAWHKQTNQTEQKRSHFNDINIHVIFSDKFTNGFYLCRKKKHFTQTNKQTNKNFQKMKQIKIVSFYRFSNHLILWQTFSSIYRKVKVCAINVRFVVSERNKFKCRVHSIPKWMITNWWLQMRTAYQIQCGLIKQSDSNVFRQN